MKYLAICGQLAYNYRGKIQEVAMANHTGLIPKIHRAEARLKALRMLLERETGLKEDEALLLDRLVGEGWTNCVNMKGKPFSISKTILVVGGLRRKELVDRDGIDFKINRGGKEALARFKEQLQEK